jgi:hypothetical protein
LGPRGPAFIVIFHRKIDYADGILDNAFVQIRDWAQAQQLAEDWKPERLHRKLDEFAQRYCPVLSQIQAQYRWSLATVEYATDIVFHRQSDLPLAVREQAY